MSQGRLGLMPEMWINNKEDEFRERSESNCCGLQWAGKTAQSRWDLNRP